MPRLGDVHKHPVLVDLRSRSTTILERQATVVQHHAKELTSLTDHSLADLRKLDYPYSRRNLNPPHVGVQVHKQSGKLHDNIRIEPVRQSGDRYRVNVGVRENQVPYINYVVMGTSKMIGRDFLFEAVQVAKPEMARIVRDEMRRGRPNR